jgi:ribonucleoside-diphosphate reductase alpha chain
VLGFTDEQLNDFRASTCSPAWASAKKDIEAANIHVCGAMTLEGAPHLKTSTAGVRLRQPLRQGRQALFVGRQPHPHDGRGPAVHLRRDLQDDQHAQRRHRRRLPGAYMLSWKLALKANALYRDGSKLSQPLSIPR